MFREFVLIFLSLTFSSCEEFKGNPFRSDISRIVNGTAMDIEMVPYYVSIFKLPLRHICGGSIISPSFVLSAAHCYVSFQVFLRFLKNNQNSSQYQELPTGYKVRSGSTRASQGGRTTNAAQFILHPSFVPSTEDFDFALIRLSMILIYNEKT